MLNVFKKNGVRFMNVEGIRTHNLKNLSFSSLENELIGICGVSGGGKTSFAYSTLYKLCADELESLSNGYSEVGDYVVDSYSALLPPIAIRQNCFNSNPHSTIYSFLNISTLLSKNQFDIPYSFLKLNKPSNFCPKCNGQGYEYELDLDKIIDEKLQLEFMPIIPWQNKEEYEKLFLYFCEEVLIDTKKTFLDLSVDDKKKILYGEGEKIFDINFKYNGKKRVRHIKYPGIINYLQDELTKCKTSSQNAIKYYSETVCSKCQGSRINTDEYQGYCIGKMSFQDFLVKPIDQVLASIIKNKINKKLFSLLESISNMGLGYLSLNRSIPSLSGGELQKLKFSLLCNADISGLLIVLDEISSGIHWSDYDSVIDQIVSMKKNNLILMIEHNDYFLSKSDRNIVLGPKPGVDGGFFIDSYEPNKKIHIEKTNESIEGFIQIDGINKNNVNNLNLKIPKGRITALVGKSGSGKTSIARYMNEKVGGSVFVTQKSLRGNIRSTVASYLKINKVIADFLGKKYNRDYSNFLPTSDIVGCHRCKGLGVIRYERGFEESYEVICPECEGMLFSDIAKEFSIDGLSLQDLYNLEINRLSKVESCKKIKKMIEHAQCLSIGHLSLCRKIQTLSGGEAKRLKILELILNSNIKDKILIIDEPGSGLDSKTCKKLVAFFQEIKDQCSAIMVIEHNPNIFLNADHIIEIGPGSGEKGGRIVFEGNIKNFLANNQELKRMANVFFA